MTKTASGTFDVKLNPVKTVFEIEHFGRMSIEKTFAGDLNGESRGEMLSALTAVQSSAGYVAIERFSGNLDGMKGSFVLQHYGIMNDGDNRLILEIVPDSGTDQLNGIRGKMEIIRNNSGHQYFLEYEV